MPVFHLNPVRRPGGGLYLWRVAEEQKGSRAKKCGRSEWTCRLWFCRVFVGWAAQTRLALPVRL